MAGQVSVATLVEAGFAVVADAGLDGLTMREVARRLGVQAPAIYWHLKSRQDLLDEMGTALLRRVLARVVERAETGAPDVRGMLAVFAHAVRDVTMAQRDGARLLAGTYLTDDSLLTTQRELLAKLLPHLDHTRVVRAYVIVYSFAIGYVIEEQARRQAGDDRYDPARRTRRLGGGTAARAQSELVLATDDATFADLLDSVVAAAAPD